MPLDFPSSPTDGQTYAGGGTTWTYNAAAGAWRGAPAGAQGPQGVPGIQGPQGATGAGTQGATGAQGAAGGAGPQGPAGTGAQGAQGPQGVAGSAGSAGAQGPQGSAGTGAQGPQGAAGAVGGAGPQGPPGTGAQGPQGNVGAQGPQGVAGGGPQGPQGAAGAASTVPGPQGVAGAQGSQGPQGSVGFGAQGPQGIAGVQGPQGVAGAGLPGPAGTQGPQGAQGAVGAQGVEGVAGPQGAVGAGAQGAAGVQGPQGVPGTGAQGPAGPQGPSLFIIASTAPSLATTPVGAAWWDLDNGRTSICYDDGTSKQWVEFIGAPGAQGAVGPQGVTGAGTQGPQGVAGVQGPQGAYGQQGVPGTPGAPGAQGPAGPVGGTHTCVISNQSGAPYGDGNFVYDPATGRATAALFTAIYDIVANRNLGVTANTTTGTLNINGSTYGADFYACRAANQGVMFFGSNGGQYIQYDGGGWRFMPAGAPLLFPGSASFGSAQVPKGTIDVMPISDKHFTITWQGPGGSESLALGNINDAYTAWNNISYQGGGAFHPTYDNTQHLGYTSFRWNTLFATNGAINTSDARLKKDVIDSPLGLNFIETLRPVQYKWIEEMAVVIPVSPTENQVTSIPGIRPHWGLIAQEVQGALRTAGFMDTGIAPLAEKEDDPLGLNYSEFIAPLVKAVQELSARVKALEATR